ncbi:latent-transforming growth factor beta-binding protein 2 [Trichonephila clavata]|uniref:Latent-transforming growth factor beta-binding protein 2 n=1 Tax=Trichonephila clavata TaxID=2740835 RepID=A0A8X6LZA1_TRICU|nr:latent-transforming growth factor beta-binding protein 2 [Trichonephila clavata]
MLPLTQSILFHNKLGKFGDKSLDQTKINETTALTKNVGTEVLERSECKCQNGKCVSQGNQEVCVCDPGFGKIGSSTCEDCKCGKGFNCTFDVGIFSNGKKCICSKGFVEKDGVCKECDCGDNGECEISRAGEKICKCKDGYFVSNGKCEDCKCGLNNTKCELIENIKICSCPNGYRDSRGVCKDIDECIFETICPPHTKCINTPGSYECACEEGYEPKSNLSDTRVDGCQDIDECLLKETCSFPSTKCVNLPGSYKCICLKGFQPINKYGDPRYTRCRDDKSSWNAVNIVFGVMLGVFLMIFLTAAFYKYRMTLRRRREGLLVNAL